MNAWWCASECLCQVYSWTCLCGTNLQRVPSSSFPSSDINIWANAVRQLLVENPQQSLAVTTWECSSEGHALPCDYKQHRESEGHDATMELPLQRLWCFLLCYKYWEEVFFVPEQFRGFKLWLVQASAATFWSWSQKTVAVLCHSRWIIAVNISEGRRYWTDLMEAVKTVMTGSVEEESNAVILQTP